MADGQANIALSIGLIFLLLIRNPNNRIRLLGETEENIQKKFPFR